MEQMFANIFQPDFITGASLVSLESLSVPPLLEAGTVCNIVLDCPYSITEQEKEGLVLKWYLNSLYIPIYQWMPPNPPQSLGTMEGKIDLTFQMSSSPHSQHRALSIRSPSIAMSGDYTCKVETVTSEVSLTSRMIVYVPPHTIVITQHHISDKVVNITCVVDRCFPKPEIKIMVDSHWYGEEDFDSLQFKK